MYRRLLNTRVSANSRALITLHPRCQPRRTISTGSDVSEERNAKYMEKLRQKAEQTGLSVTQLIEKAKSKEAERRKDEAEKLKAAASAFQKPVTVKTPSSTPPSKSPAVPSPNITERKDAPPFKALGSILNIPRILATPHTADQVSALWTAYHASRSGGTGRGYVCASIPLEQFSRLQKIGKRYPSFVVPVPRIQLKSDDAEPLSPQEETAHEFYYLQWDFHPPPPIPSASDDPFLVPGQTPSEGSNPPSATVLFTPLQEYKLRGSFATPYLVLTLYTDFATTHGVVLLRGEITPSTSNGQGSPDRWMLAQPDAQVLTLALQKFYLWNDKRGTGGIPEGERLLSTFHESPEDFKWEELLAFAQLTI